MRARSYAQGVRDNARTGTGKFAKLNPCNGCGKSGGADPISDDRCNDGAFGGFGLTLCKRCGPRVCALDDAAYLALAVARGFVAGDEGAR